ncbi:hypothetical protein ACJ41O_014231 [Fusarium nematophilum]
MDATSESSAAAAKRRMRRIPDEFRKRNAQSCDRCRKVPFPRRIGRYRCLEALVKGAFPDESLDTITDLAQLGQRMGYKMPSLADPNRPMARMEDLVQTPTQRTSTSLTDAASTTDTQAGDSSPTGAKAQSEEPQASLVKDNSGHEHYIGPSGTLNFWNQLRKLVDTNDGPQESPGREGVAKFTRDNTTQALEAADDQEEEVAEQPESAESAPQDGPSPGSITSAIARDFTRLPTADMDEILGQFPPNEVLEQLIHSYFKVVHDDFPLFHRATFEDEYELYIVQARRRPQLGQTRPRPLPDWGWIGCLHMMIVFGSIADRTIPNVDHAALRRKSVTVARALLPQFISKCSLTNVRVLLLLALFLHNNNERNAAWNLTGTATRISFALGLHRSDMSSSFRPLEREVRKWVFCTLYTFEQFLASSLGRPSGLQELDVEIVPPREGFVDGGMGTDAKLVSWSLKLQGILARTRLLHLATNRSISAPTIEEIMGALEAWKRDIGQAPGFDVPWVKSSGPGLASADDANAMDMEELKVSLAWKTRAQLRAVLLLHIQFNYIAIVATRPLLLRDVALMRKTEAGAPKPSISPHAAVCVKHACQLSNLIILLDHFDVINGLSGLDIFYGYCAAMILILRLLRLRPGETAEGSQDDEAALQRRIRNLVSTTRDVINHTDKSGSMKRFAQVVDTFSECANNPNEPPNLANLQPPGYAPGANMSGVAYHPLGAMDHPPPDSNQGMTFGSMEGLLDFLPMTGFGAIDGSMGQFMSTDMTMPEWSDMEMLLAGYGDQTRMG